MLGRWGMEGTLDDGLVVVVVDGDDDDEVVRSSSRQAVSSSEASTRRSRVPLPAGKEAPEWAGSESEMNGRG